MLFLRKSLYPGAVLPEGTQLTSGGSPPRFINADDIPFSSKELDTILRTFKIQPGSEKAKQVIYTLSTCEAAASSEPQACVNSRRAAARFAARWLGTSEVRPLVTVVHGGNEVAAARYVVASNGIKRINSSSEDALVPCHTMPYPYGVYYCHRPAGVEALRVELIQDRRTTTAGGASAVAVCHTDTSSWDDGYFELLNATRGAHICHFMPQDYVLWLPGGGM